MSMNNRAEGEAGAEARREIGDAARAVLARHGLAPFQEVLHLGQKIIFRHWPLMPLPDGSDDFILTKLHVNARRQRDKDIN